MPSTFASMVRFAVLMFCLTVVSSFPRLTTISVMDSDVRTSEANLAQGQATANVMFREAEKLMVDTQHKLEEAEYQMDNQSSNSILYSHNLPPNYHDESSTEKMVGNQSIHIVQKIEIEILMDNGAMDY